MFSTLKKTMVDVLDRALRILGMRIASASDGTDRWTMQQGLCRVSKHAFQIGTVIDIGASNGKWSVLAMKYFPGAHYLLFEPLEERRAELEKLTSRHSNLQYVLAAAGARSGKTGFHVMPDLDGSGIDSHAGDASRSIDVVTIDEEIEKRGLPGPYLLKFDTHGFELPILDGAAKTLRKTSLIIMEVYNFTITPTAVKFPGMCAHLEKLGFRCYDMVDPTLRKDDSVLWQMDLFFCPVKSSLFSVGDV